MIKVFLILNIVKKHKANELLVFKIMSVFDKIDINDEINPCVI